LRLFFGFTTPKDWRDWLKAYTSNMLVFLELIPAGEMLKALE
jgi:hypothetical protein